MAKFCTNCGTPTNTDSNVCLNCGAPTGNNNNNDKKKKGLPTWAIILIVVGSVLILPILLLVGGFVAYKTLSTSSQTMIGSQTVLTTKELTTEIINEEGLGGLTVDSIILDRDEVVIKGSEEDIEKVETVKAIINLEDIEDLQNGNNFVDDITLVAYDELGNTVDVKTVPNKITATVKLSLYSANVNIKIIPIGDLAYGKAISSFTTSINTITIYGAEEIINEYKNSYIPVEIDVYGLYEDKTFTVDIEKIKGITKMSEEKITVKITLGEEMTKEIEDIRIDVVNLGANLKASAIGENSTKTTVVVKGTKEVIEEIDVSSIRATVDLVELGEGEYIVDIEITGDDTRAIYMPKTTKIKVKISES